MWWQTWYHDNGDEQAFGWPKVQEKVAVATRQNAYCLCGLRNLRLALTITRSYMSVGGKRLNIWPTDRCLGVEIVLPCMASSSRASDCHSLQEVVYRDNQGDKQHGVGEHFWKTWLAAGADWDDVLQEMYRVGRRDRAMRTKRRVTRPLMRRRRVGNAPVTMTMKKEPPDIEGTGAGVGSLSMKEERPACSVSPCSEGEKKEATEENCVTDSSSLAAATHDKRGRPLGCSQPSFLIYGRLWASLF